jgi:hypothetical protein
VPFYRGWPLSACAALGVWVRGRPGETPCEPPRHPCAAAVAVMSPRASWRPSEWRNGQYAGPPAATSSALPPSLSLFYKLPPDSLRLVLSYTCCLDAVLSLAAAFPGLIPDAMAAEWARDVALGSPWPTHLAVYTNASIYTPDSEWPSYRYLGSPEPNPISAHWVVSDVRGLNELRYWHAPRRRVCRVCLARPLGAAFSSYTGAGKVPLSAV